MSDPINYDSDTLDTITISSLTTADISSLSNTMMGPYISNTSLPTYGNITIRNTGAASGSYYTNGTNSSNWASITGSNKHPSIQITGDAEFEGKVKINGQDLAQFMETLSKRLAILVPDPEKLEHFAALKKAYDHYKTLEALCEVPKKEEE